MFGDVVRVMAVQGVLGDREGHREELERDGARDRLLGAVLGVTDAGLVLGLFEAHLDRPAVGVALNNLCGGAVKVSGDQRELIAGVFGVVADEDHADGSVGTERLPQAIDHVQL